MKEATLITGRIMRGIALEKANKYYRIYRGRQNQHYLEIQEDCLEISLYYFNIYFICLKEVIENENDFKFLGWHNPRVPKPRDPEDFIRARIVERAYSGIPLLRDWRIEKNSVEEMTDNPFYEDSSSLFKSEQTALVLQRLINNYDESKLTQVLNRDNPKSFLDGRKRFQEGQLDQFSYFFYRVRNHVVHAGKNMEDAREKQIMEDMCMVLSEYTKTIENKCKSLGI